MAIALGTLARNMHLRNIVLQYCTVYITPRTPSLALRTGLYIIGVSGDPGYYTYRVSATPGYYTY